MKRRKPFWSAKNGGCELHDRPKATFGCGGCIAELPKLRAEIARLRKIIADAGRAALRGAK